VKTGERGVDDNGFFIDPEQPNPEIQISNITGDVEGAGRLRFLLAIDSE
jgi:hypothetical protein